MAVEWIIDPFASFGPLEFGMTRREAQNALEETPEQFTKGFSPSTVEAYDETGGHVYYDDNERVEFIEAFSPCRPVYAGFALLLPEVSKVVEDLTGAGLHLRRDERGGFWFDDHGFALYAPDGRTEAVSVFRRGYDTGA